MAYRSTYGDISSIADSLKAINESFVALNGKLDTLNTTLISVVDAISGVSLAVEIQDSDGVKIRLQ